MSLDPSINQSATPFTTVQTDPNAQQTTSTTTTTNNTDTISSSQTETENQTVNASTPSLDFNNMSSAKLFLYVSQASSNKKELDFFLMQFESQVNKQFLFFFNSAALLIQAKNKKDSQSTTPPTGGGTTNPGGGTTGPGGTPPLTPQQISAQKQKEFTKIINSLESVYNFSEVEANQKKIIANLKFAVELLSDPVTSQFVRQSQAQETKEIQKSMLTNQQQVANTSKTEGKTTSEIISSYSPYNTTDPVIQKISGRTSLSKLFNQFNLSNTPGNNTTIDQLQSLSLKTLTHGALISGSLALNSLGPDSNQLMPQDDATKVAVGTAFAKLISELISAGDDSIQQQTPTSSNKNTQNDGQTVPNDGQTVPSVNDEKTIDNSSTKTDQKLADIKQAIAKILNSNEEIAKMPENTKNVFTQLVEAEFKYNLLMAPLTNLLAIIHDPQIFNQLVATNPSISNAQTASAISAPSNAISQAGNAPVNSNNTALFSSPSDENAQPVDPFDTSSIDYVSPTQPSLLSSLQNQDIQTQVKSLLTSKYDEQTAQNVSDAINKSVNTSQNQNNFDPNALNENIVNVLADRGVDPNQGRDISATALSASLFLNPNFLSNIPSTQKNIIQETTAQAIKSGDIQDSELFQSSLEDNLQKQNLGFDAKTSAAISQQITSLFSNSQINQNTQTNQTSASASLDPQIKQLLVDQLGQEQADTVIKNFMNVLYGVPTSQDINNEQIRNPHSLLGQVRQQLYDIKENNNQQFTEKLHDDFRESQSLNTDLTQLTQRLLNPAYQLVYALGPMYRGIYDKKPETPGNHINI